MSKAGRPLLVGADAAMLCMVGQWIWFESKSGGDANEAGRAAGQVSIEACKSTNGRCGSVAGGGLEWLVCRPVKQGGQAHTCHSAAGRKEDGKCWPVKPLFREALRVAPPFCPGLLSATRARSRAAT